MGAPGGAYMGGISMSPPGGAYMGGMSEMSGSSQFGMSSSPSYFNPMDNSFGALREAQPSIKMDLNYGIDNYADGGPPSAMSQPVPLSAVSSSISSPPPSASASVTGFSSSVALKDLLALQAFDGMFGPSDSVYRILWSLMGKSGNSDLKEKVSECLKKVGINGGGGEVEGLGCTVLVMVYLENRCGGSKSSWSMMFEKSQSYVLKGIGEKLGVSKGDARKTLGEMMLNMNVVIGC